MAVGHAFQHVLEVGEWLEAIGFRHSQQRGEDRPVRRAAASTSFTVSVAGLMSAMTTWAPSCANRFANAWPMPPAAPVTTATLSS